MAIMGMENNELLSFNEAIVEEFRANEGRCGGRFEGNPMILLTMTGAKSGRTLTSPLTYHRMDDDLIVMASAGGSPGHPAWYFNLVANPSVVVEVGTDRYDAAAVKLEGDDRTSAFASMAEAMPRFADYQAGVEREIPFFKLVRS